LKASGTAVCQCFLYSTIQRHHLDLTIRSICLGGLWNSWSSIVRPPLLRNLCVVLHNRMLDVLQGTPPLRLLARLDLAQN